MTRAVRALGDVAALVGSTAVQPARWWVPPSPPAGPGGGGPGCLGEPIHHHVQGAASIHVGEWGPADGPPVLLVHGFTGNSGDWSMIVPNLVASGHRVLAVDLPGHGRSSGGRGARLDTDHLADEIALVIEHLGLADLILVGHSLGGSVVLAMAARHRELATARLRHIVPVSATTAIRRPPEIATILLGGHPASTLMLSDRVWGRTFMQLAAFAPGATSVQLDDMRLRWAACPIPVRMSYAVSLIGDDIRAQLPEIPVPVTAVAGNMDRMCPPSRAATIADAVPDGRLRLVTGSGHAVLTEQPDVIAAIITGTTLRTRP